MYYLWACIIVWLWTGRWNYQDEVSRWLCPHHSPTSPFHRYCGHNKWGKPRFLP